ncbi:DNA binding methylated-DNA--cysteine S-methyltransferase [Phlegmacium glaucopus]|nr:DNA binding methylated-DNA--cysteine S-methyltransferase [Phlegmacium glaucopus]
MTMMKSPYFNHVSPLEQTGDLNAYEDVPSIKPTTSEVTSVYPVTDEARNIFRTNKGKCLTAHQWAVYDFVLKIPRGKVTTYKDVSLAVGGSPRSVGNALRNNPFSPHVPCHRVTASNFFVGGFFGEWGKGDKTGTRYNQKVFMLSQEEVHFDSNGYLKASDRVLLKPGNLEKT